jgi:hypothetical protein
MSKFKRNNIYLMLKHPLTYRFVKRLTVDICIWIWKYFWRIDSVKKRYLKWIEIIYINAIKINKAWWIMSVEVYFDWKNYSNYISITKVQ